MGDTANLSPSLSERLRDRVLRLGVGLNARASLAVILTSLMGGCGPEPVPPPEIAVTIHPLRLVVDALAGEEFRVVTLLPGGVSPHAFDPVPSTARMAADADLVIAVAPEVDAWAASPGGARTWWFGEASGDPDPHAWLDPRSVRRALPLLSVELCTLFPGRCEYVQDQAAAMDRDLADLAEIMSGALEGRKAVVSGPWLNAFARSTGLVIQGMVSPVEGVEPSPSDLGLLIETARATGLVLGQTVLPERAARLVAQSSGARFLAVDPIGDPNVIRDYRSLLTTILSGILNDPAPDGS